MLGLLEPGTLSCPTSTQRLGLESDLLIESDFENPSMSLWRNSFARRKVDGTVYSTEIS